MYFFIQTLKRKAAYRVITIFLFAFGVFLSHEYSVNEIDFKAINPYVIVNNHSDTFRIYGLLEKRGLSPVICVVEDDMKNMEERITAIGNDNALDKLFSKAQLGDGCQNRMFGLSKSLYSVRAEELTDSFFTDGASEIFCVLMEDRRKILDVPAEWLWENGIGNIYIPQRTIRMNLYPRLFAVWLIICLICVFLMCFNAEINRKAICTWILNGAGYGFAIFLELMVSALYYAMLCIAMVFLISHIGIVMWAPYSPVLICAILFCTDAICFLLMFKMNIRKVFTTDSGDQRLLVFAFFLKGVAAMFVLLAISLNSKSISDFNSLSRNYAFYDLHKDHYILPEPVGEEWDDYHSFYQEEIKNGNAELYMYLYSTQNETPVFKININSLTWIRELYPSLADIDAKRNMIIAPASCDRTDIAKLEKLIASVSKGETGVYYYKEKVYLPMIGAGEDSRIASSKDIIFVAYDYIPSAASTYEPDLLWVMYRSSTGSFKINENTMLEGKNISTSFFEEYKTKKDLFLMGVICVAVLVGFEAVLTAYVVNIEYKLNASVFALRRINGTGPIGTYSFMFIADIMTVVISMTVSLIIGSRNIEEFSISVAVVGMLFLTVLECVTGAVCILINEKRSIVKVFKAGGI